MTDPRRNNPRFEVGLAVRFSRAQDFVAQYAENLSSGGLFIAGDHRDLEPLSLINVDIDLPGFDSFVVRGRVAHILDPERANAFGRSPGVGVEIVESPKGFTEALMGYLDVLGKRRDASVLAPTTELVEFFVDAGFVAVLAPSDNDLATHIEGAKPPALAIVVTRDLFAAYNRAQRTDDNRKPLPIVQIGSEKLARSALAPLDALLRKR